MKLSFFRYAFSASVLVSSAAAFSASPDCSALNHYRTYWVDEDGTPHWRQYSFSVDCKSVLVEKGYNQDLTGESYVDKIDGEFRCLKQGDKFCEFGFSWTLTPEGTIVSRTQRTEEVQGSELYNFPKGRLSRRTLDRTILLGEDGEVKESSVSTHSLKDPQETEWFDVNTSQGRCRLKPDYDCGWKGPAR